MTGISLVGLMKIGSSLTVDRIDPSKGYTFGNMRLIAAELNSAKGNQKEVPKRAIRRLLERWERVRWDELSAPAGMG